MSSGAGSSGSLRHRSRVSRGDGVAPTGPSERCRRAHGVEQPFEASATSSTARSNASSILRDGLRGSRSPCGRTAARRRGSPRRCATSALAQALDAPAHAGRLPPRRACPASSAARDRGRAPAASGRGARSTSASSAGPTGREPLALERPHDDRGRAARPRRRGRRRPRPPPGTRAASCCGRARCPAGSSAATSSTKAASAGVGGGSRRRRSRGAATRRPGRREQRAPRRPATPAPRARRRPPPRARPSRPRPSPAGTAPATTRRDRRDDLGPAMNRLADAGLGPGTPNVGSYGIQPMPGYQTSTHACASDCAPRSSR